MMLKEVDYASYSDVIYAPYSGLYCVQLTVAESRGLLGQTGITNNHSQGVVFSWSYGLPQDLIAMIVASIAQGTSNSLLYHLYME